MNVNVKMAGRELIAVVQRWKLLVLVLVMKLALDLVNAFVDLVFAMMTLAMKGQPVLIVKHLIW